MKAISAGDFGKRRSWISLWYNCNPSWDIAQAWSDRRARSWQLQLHTRSARIWFLEWLREGSSWKVCTLSSLALFFLSSASHDTDHNIWMCLTCWKPNSFSESDGMPWHYCEHVLPEEKVKFDTKYGNAIGKCLSSSELHSITFRMRLKSVFWTYIRDLDKAFCSSAESHVPNRCAIDARTPQTRPYKIKLSSGVRSVNHVSLKKLMTDRRLEFS